MRYGGGIEQSEIEHKPDSMALSFNNKAVRLMSKVWPGNDSLNSVLYDSALYYLDQGIEIDSLFTSLYINKSKVLQKKGLLEEAVSILDTVLKIRPDFAEVIMEQGFLFEKMGRVKLANEKYKLVLSAYEKRLGDNPMSIKTRADIAFLYLFLEDRNRAIDEIQNLILENPKNEDLKATEELIKNFDRKRFIEEY